MVIFSVGIWCEMINKICSSNSIDSNLVRRMMFDVIVCEIDWLLWMVIGVNCDRMLVLWSGSYVGIFDVIGNVGLVEWCRKMVVGVDLIWGLVWVCFFCFGGGGGFCWCWVSGCFLVCCDRVIVWVVCVVFVLLVFMCREFCVGKCVVGREIVVYYEWLGWFVVWVFFWIVCSWGW